MNRVLGTFLVAAIALTACQGRYASPPVTPQIPGLASAHPAATMPDCDASQAKLPGKYVLMNSEGNVDAGKGTYRTSIGHWDEGMLSATSAPSPGPTGEPSPPPVGTYVYVGTYRLDRTGQTGCAYLVTTIDHKGLEGKDDATLEATPRLDTRNFSFKETTYGKLLVTASGLGASSGTGSLRLMTRSGATYDRGSIAFTRRLRVRDRTAGLSAIVRPNYTFSCDPSKYKNGLVNIPASPALTHHQFIYHYDLSYTYRSHFAFCGVDNSNLDNLFKIVFESDNGAGTSWMIAFQLNQPYDWAAHPDVVLWSSAYFLGFIPSPLKNADVSLLRIR